MTAPPAACRLCGSGRVCDRFPAHDPDLKVCRDCGVIFRAAPVSAQDLLHTYDRDYYLSTWPGSLGRFFQDFDPQQHHKTRFFARQLQELARLAPGRRLLDVGCANGVFVWMARSAGWDAEGVELSPFAAEWGRKQFGVTIHQGDLHNVAPEPGYDAITMWDTLEHLPDPAAALHAASLRLNPGGCLAVLTPDTESLLNTLIHATAWLLPRRARPLLAKLYHPDHLTFFQRGALAAALLKQGLSIHWMESYDEDPRDTETRGLVRAGVWAVSFAALLLARRHELLIYAQKPKDPLAALQS